MNKDEMLLAEIEDIIRMTPEGNQIRADTEENLSWMGRACAAIEEWDPTKRASMEMATHQFNSNGVRFYDGFRVILGLIYQARSNLRFKTLGPINTAIGQGQVFDYFDEIRKIIEGAATEVFFVDPYINADFVARYLPHLKPSVQVRLLTTKDIPALLASVEMFARQNGTRIEVRSSKGFHDRWLIVDRAQAFQSGASFKDGATRAPTTLMQNTDLFPDMLKTYEALWADAKVERP